MLHTSILFLRKKSFLINQKAFFLPSILLFFAPIVKTPGLIIILLFSLSCSTKKEGVIVLNTESCVEIIIDASAYKKLEGYRDIALKNGVIDKRLKKYVKATLTYRGVKTLVKLRLKGDWVDHLKEDKWSFRVKVPDGDSFLGLKSFSIQSPHTRSFIHEWFMHQIYLKEGVLTTRYEFVPVSVNGKQMGIYALEEHFDKQLAEAKNKREGPILKFNEEGVWETRVGEPGSYHSLPYFAAAEVVPFKKNRTMNSAVLKNHFKTAQSLLLRYKAFDDNIEEIFDIDRLAKFYALTDIANTDHALIWHNLRFYYNPVSRKLEPIAYDCYPEKVEMSANQPIFGYSKDQTAFPDFSFIHYNIFNNASFKSLYVAYLKKFSSDKYLNAVFNELDSSLTSIGKLLEPEYPESKFSKIFYKNNIKAIQEALPEYISSDIEYSLQDYHFEDLTNTNTYYYNTGLKAYSSPFQDSTINTVQLVNFHSTPVTIVGYGLKQNKDSIVYLGKEKTIDKFNNNLTVHFLNLPKSTNKIYFLANQKIPDTLHVSISNWAFNSKLIKPLGNLLTSDLSRIPYIEINALSKLLIIKKGDYVLSSDLIVPKGWTLILEKGCKINLINTAAIISYSPIHAEGSSEEKILIYSSDKSGQGVTVINNYGESLFQNVVFNHLTTLTKYGWRLTGAVTLYQSNVTIESCTFKNNYCEDAINLVQSNFTFSNSTVENTFSDGLDSDFCNGTISGSIFKNTGNDCIDLSGSTIEINHCAIENSGDKGVSGGENSIVKIENTKINRAKIAIASKDLSTVTVGSVTMQNVDYGFVAFQKKPEFGPAKIIVKNNNKELQKNNLIDIGSLLIMQGKVKPDTIKGLVSLNIDSLYYGVSITQK
jgi:hypothetical protein